MTREELLALRDQPKRVEEITLPCSGKPVCIRQLDGTDYLLMQRFLASAGDRELAGFACWVLCDENGQRLLKDEDVECIAGMAGGDLQRIFERASVLNGISAKAREDAEKN